MQASDRGSAEPHGRGPRPSQTPGPSETCKWGEPTHIGRSAAQIWGIPDDRIVPDEDISDRGNSMLTARESKN
jgi:hypothetical protein